MIEREESLKREGCSRKRQLLESSMAAEVWVSKVCAVRSDGVTRTTSLPAREGTRENPCYTYRLWYGDWLFKPFNRTVEPETANQKPGSLQPRPPPKSNQGSCINIPTRDVITFKPVAMKEKYTLERSILKVVPGEIWITQTLYSLVPLCWAAGEILGYFCKLYLQ